VLADGSVVGDMSGLTAGAAGYDIAQLLTGSEGTLAVITAARLRLRIAEPPAAVLMAGVAGIDEAADLLAQIEAVVPGVLAGEYFDSAGLDLVYRAVGLPLPPGYDRRAESRGAPSPGTRADPGGFLLAELAAGDGGSGDISQRLADAALPDETWVATDARGMAALWAYRERLTEAIATAGIPHKIDVAVPAAQLGAFRSELDGIVREASPHDGEPLVIVFGHIGVGNLHVNVIGLDPADTSVDAAVASLVAAHGGSVAAEHGIGRAKSAWLGLTKSAAEIAAMRAIKTALDPAGLLNPGVLLPPEHPARPAG
jgi:FAD/FMN-containing dehydrogenase